MGAHWDKGVLTVTIDGVLHGHTIDPLLRQIGDLRFHTLSEIHVDMRNVQEIRPAGLCYLVCLLSWLCKATSGHHVATHLTRPREAIISRLVKFGAFSLLANRARLTESQDLIQREMLARDEDDRRRLRKGSAPATHDKSRGQVILPLSVIPQRTNALLGDDFETACIPFVNRAADKFQEIFERKMEALPQEREKQFWSANIELYKNTFHHSQSWGLVTIVASIGHGAVVCFHDIGIGMKTSVNSSSLVSPKFVSDADAIEWALVDGHSSRADSNGRGFTIVSECVKAAQGRLEIRSGNARFIRRGCGVQWERRAVPDFPGTHIDIFFPEPQSKRIH